MSLELSFSNPKVTASFESGTLIPLLNLRNAGKEIDIDISQSDFCELIVYFLTNIDLIGVDDPRFKLMERIESMKIIDGFNTGCSRFSEGLRTTK